MQGRVSILHSHGGLRMDTQDAPRPRKRKRKALHKLIDAANLTKDGVPADQRTLPHSVPTLEDIREALLRREGD